MFPIVTQQTLAPDISRIVVHAPYVARKRRPGHFVIVRVEADGERIPLTIADSDETSTITLVVQAVGKTTRRIAALRAGDSLLDVLGPLGQPTAIEHFGAVACVAGGVGAAVVLPVARALRLAGNDVFTVLGARTKDLMILEDELAACSREIAISTDDGSHGRRGQVTDALRARLARPERLDFVFAAGPLPMMKAVADVTRPYGVRTCVSLNPIMVDGTGMCGGCRVQVEGRTAFACVDGPEFDAHAVDLDELMRRNRMYRRQELAADRGCEAPAGDARPRG